MVFNINLSKKTSLFQRIATQKLENNPKAISNLRIPFSKICLLKENSPKTISNLQTPCFKGCLPKKHIKSNPKTISNFQTPFSKGRLQKKNKATSDLRITFSKACILKKNKEKIPEQSQISDSDCFGTIFF